MITHGRGEPTFRVSTVHDVPLDTGLLREFADQIRQYYANLSDRIDQVPDEDRPEDRMNM